MEPNRVNKPRMIEPVVHTTQTGLILTGVAFTHHKAKVNLTALTWTEAGSTGGLLYFCYTLSFL